MAFPMDVSDVRAIPAAIAIAAEAFKAIALHAALRRRTMRNG